MRKFTAIALLAAAVATPGYADLMLEYQDDEGAHVFSMFVKEQRMRLETHGDHPSVTLFDSATRSLTVLEPSDRSYMVVDQDAIQAMRAQMEQAFEMMRSRGLDPAAMGLDFSPQAETRVVATGETRVIGDRECAVVRYVVNDKVSTLACVVGPTELGIDEAEWQTINGMFETLAQMTAQMLPGGGMNVEMQPSAGIPVEAYDEDGGGIQRLTRVEHAPLAGSMFEVPDGWRRVRMDR